MRRYVPSWLTQQADKKEAYVSARISLANFNHKGGV